ncbi:Hypothetical protein NTJ_14672 [Nesidiocoris tenuis]|uniref:Uncharacterized protein n=1 Tax=Nesidiocoris tenuis TaxID=355587 RepID=A0ABN7BC19_9HEMI|nr:Hypothetical protein NTJ_14672 [Nesidiocoris tenuis]
MRRSGPANCDEVFLHTGRSRLRQKSLDVIAFCKADSIELADDDWSLTENYRQIGIFQILIESKSERNWEKGWTC